MFVEELFHFFFDPRAPYPYTVTSPGIGQRQFCTPLLISLHLLDIARMTDHDPNTKKTKESGQIYQVWQEPCSGCGKRVQLFQQNLCKSCLTQSFKKLVKIIDSVRI